MFSLHLSVLLGCVWVRTWYSQNLHHLWDILLLNCVYHYKVNLKLTRNMTTQLHCQLSQMQGEQIPGLDFKPLGWLCFDAHPLGLGWMRLTVWSCCERVLWEPPAPVFPSGHCIALAVLLNYSLGQEAAWSCRAFAPTAVLCSAGVLCTVR